jgi:hypothetical protein
LEPSALARRPRRAHDRSGGPTRAVSPLEDRGREGGCASMKCLLFQMIVFCLVICGAAVRSEVSQSSSLLSLSPALRSPPPSQRRRSGACNVLDRISQNSENTRNTVSLRPISRNALGNATKVSWVRTIYTPRDHNACQSDARARARVTGPVPHTHGPGTAPRRPTCLAPPRITPYSMLQHPPISLFTLPRAARRTVAHATNAEAAAVLSTRLAAQHCG